MKAIVKAKAAPGLDLKEVEKPKCGPNEVLIKVKMASICGSDLHIYKWDDWASATTKVPVVIGHEFVGHIEEVGSNVEGFEIGERVSAEGHIVCGKCKNCLEGNKYLCPNTIGYGRECDGVFAEYAALPAENIWKAADDISDEVMSCFDPFGNAVHSVLEYDLVGQDIIIAGAGPIGCMTAAIAKHAGARHVVVTDMNEYRLKIAKQMGATRVVNIDEENLQDVVDQELNLDGGFDVGMEMSGSPKGLAEIIDTMKMGGNVSLLGVLPDGAPADWVKIVFKCLNLKGIYGRKIFKTWYQATRLIQSGLDITPIITHRMPYTDFEKGFELMFSGQAGKVILDWS